MLHLSGLFQLQEGIGHITGADLLAACTLGAAQGVVTSLKRWMPFRFTPRTALGVSRLNGSTAVTTLKNIDLPAGTRGDSM